ncbi:restriction endonuclease subunit S [Spiroplasma endosymbiont of Polydrusus pterygomalis]|uniref:restriction endonuclease subunit S n=1 Tax=Spiroplasma endosymbiont of Polydrusus pterygomalis TaxID=3139327 RepID=UPI003CCAAEEB
MNKSLVPKIRFKGFNDEWKKYKINEIYKLKRGCVISKEILSKNKEANFFPVYSSQTSNNGIMGWTNSYLFEKNKIIWTTDGANAGTIRFVNEKFYASNVCGVLIGKKDHYNNYSFAISINLEAKKHVNKNGNPKLMNNIMGNINFYNSKSKNEQTKVAQFFTIIDKKIELVKEQLSLLAKQKQYYLNNMFANEKGYPQIRFKEFINENNFQKVKLRTIATIWGGSTPSTKNKKLWLNEIPFITPNFITKNNSMLLNKYDRFITDKNFNFSKKNDILLTCRAPVGVVTINNLEKCWFSQGIKNIRTGKLINHKYLYYWLYNNKKCINY